MSGRDVMDLVRAGNLPVVAGPDVVERVERAVEEIERAVALHRRIFADATIKDLAYLASPTFRHRLHEIIGERVRAEREARGLGLRELARMARVDPSNLSTIEHGRLCSRRTLMRVCRVFEAHPAPSKEG